MFVTLLLKPWSRVRQHKNYVPVCLGNIPFHLSVKRAKRDLLSVRIPKFNKKATTLRHSKNGCKRTSFVPYEWYRQKWCVVRSSTWLNWAFQSALFQQRRQLWKIWVGWCGRDQVGADAFTAGWSREGDVYVLMTRGELLLIWGIGKQKCRI